MGDNTNQFLKNLNRFLIFSLFFFLPTQLGKHFVLGFSYLKGVFVDYLSPTIYLTDIIILVLLLINIKILTKIFRNKKFAILLFLLSANVYFSISTPIAIYRFFKVFELIIVYSIIKNLLDKNVIKKSIFLMAVFASLLIEVPLAVFQLVNKHSFQKLFYWLGERLINLSTPGIAKVSINGVELLRAYGTFSHPNSLAGFYLLIYFFITMNDFPKNRLLKNLSLLLSASLILISFSKIAIIIFVILNIGYFFKRFRKNCFFCFVSKTITFFFIGLIFLYVKGDKFSLQKRIYLTENSLKIIRKFPFRGVGIGNFIIAQGGYSSPFLDTITQPVHNIFLLIVSELGIIISLLILVLFWENIVNFFKKNSYLFLIISFTGFFDHYWLTLQQNFILLGVIFALSLF